MSLIDVIEHFHLQLSIKITILSSLSGCQVTTKGCPDFLLASYGAGNLVIMSSRILLSIYLVLVMGKWVNI